METYDVVLDTSVVVQWYSSQKELHVQHAIGLLKKYETLGFEKIIIPDVLVLELFNALLIGKELPISLVEHILNDFYGLGMTIVAVDMQIIALAMKIAHKNKMTMYDAVFPALAHIYECRLISDDGKSHGKMKDENIQMLSDFSLSGP